MQSTGQASTQAVSLVPMQGSAIMYAIVYFPEELDHSIGPRENTSRLPPMPNSGLVPARHGCQRLLDGRTLAIFHVAAAHLVEGGQNGVGLRQRCDTLRVKIQSGAGNRPQRHIVCQRV